MKCDNCKRKIEEQWSWCTDPDCILERIGSKRSHWIKKEVEKKEDDNG